MNPTPSETINELRGNLKRFEQRYRLCDGWTLLQKTFWIMLAGSLLIQGAGRYWPIDKLWLWTLGPFVLWLLTILLWVLWRPNSDEQTAYRLDAELALKERIGTALYLDKKTNEETRPVSAIMSEHAGAIVHRQQQDALAMLRTIEPQHALPFLWNQRALLGAAVVAILLSALVILPNPMDQVVAERAAVVEALQAEAEKMDDLREELANSDALAPDEKEKVLSELETLAKALQAEPQDREEALARLSEMEELLRRRLDENRFAQKQMLESLAAQLQALSENESRDDELGLDESLNALKQFVEMLETLDAEEQSALADSLARMAANAAQAGDGSLAQALAAMGQAAGVGDAGTMAQAANNVAQAVADSMREAAQQGELQEAMAQLQQSREAIVQAGREQGQDIAHGEGRGQGQNAGQGRGGVGAGGGGTTAEQLPPARRNGQGNLTQGQERGSMMGDLGEQVYVPWERRPDTDEQSFIAGQETGQGETRISEQQNPLPGLDSSTLIPYQAVYSNYVESANQAIERSTIPPSLKEYVRDYFVQLEP